MSILPPVTVGTCSLPGGNTTQPSGCPSKRGSPSSAKQRLTSPRGWRWRGPGPVMHTRSTERRPASDLSSRESVSYTHLRAHETPEHLVCRLLLEKKKN